MSTGDLAGKANALLDALREKGLHLANPARVDGDADGWGLLAAEVRSLANEKSPVIRSVFQGNGDLAVHWDGPFARPAAAVEARVHTPFHEAPVVYRGAFTASGDGAILAGIHRDGPIVLVVYDAAAMPLAWCLVAP